MGRSDTDDRGGLALFYRKVKQRGDVALYAGNPFGEVLKEVSMRLGVSIILSIVTRQEWSGSHPKGLGNVASRPGRSDGIGR